MLKAVCFDLDGTLLDRDQSLIGVVSAQYERYSTFITCAQEQYVCRFVQLDQRGYVWKDKVYQQFIEENIIQGIPWEDLLEDFVSRFSEHAVAFPSVPEVLSKLKQSGYKLGIITNGFDRLQRSNMKALQLEAYVDDIIISESAGLRKPDPAIFELALSNLAVRAEEAVYVGDHPVNDVEASIRAGMKAVWKRDQHMDKPSRVNGIIDHFDELAELIGGL
ncbi:HAD family hydrolase [Marinicrinis lubricantis]|uniref:HAD family hydrolase n=1 Tax=Marinicrinis lubricantis TaxID=2086470 RepID=A0ABW1ING4_9BACL